MNIIYFDMVEVNDDIKSFVNINKFGDLYYKKMSLFEHSRRLFEENQIKSVHRVTNKEELKKLIEKLTHSAIEEYLFISSNMVIVNANAFAVFLKKIKYIETALAVCGYDCVKPLLKMSHRDVLKFLNQLSNNEHSLYELLNQSGENLERFNQENFYHEISSYPDFVTYLQSSFELRFFNSIQSIGNTITKRSEMKDKMKKEFSYYSILPDEMKLYFLPPFKFKEYDNYAEYSLEKLHVLDVSIQWIHFSLSVNEFGGLMQRLFEFIHRRKTIELSKEDAIRTGKDLYEDKLRKRIVEFKSTTVFKSINNIIADSTEYNSFDEIIDKYFELYKIINKKPDTLPVALSHGDLCFSNILYDKRISLLKLIDPRGCLVEEDGYLNYFYDIAKLSHSILGNYDFINSGIFEIKYSDQLKANLEITSLYRLEEQKYLFKKKLIENGYSYKKIRLYEASLFLSMLPLHIDYPKKVLAFVLTAISILRELENEKYY